MKRISLCAAVALTAGLAPGQLFERLITSPFVPVPSNDAIAEAVIDIDGDGRPDLLLREDSFGSATTLQLYRNEANGRFVRIQTLPFVGYQAVDSTVGDFDGDGDQDLVIDQLLLRNDGSVLQPVVLQLGPLAQTRPIAADLDGDGRDELLIVLNGPGAGTGLRVMRTNASGGFFDDTAASLTTQLYGSSLAGFDADFDGDIDVVLLGNWFAPLVGWLLRNDGTGVLTAEPLPLPNGFAFSSAMHTGDFDGDGDRDLLVQLTPIGQPTLLLRNDGAGHFSTTTTTGRPMVDLDGAVGDWDLDGIDDLVQQDAVRSLRGAQFEVVHTIRGYRLLQPLLADLDGDLDLDAIGHHPLAVYSGGYLPDHHEHRLPAPGAGPIGPGAIAAKSRNPRTVIAASQYGQVTYGYPDPTALDEIYQPLRVCHTSQIGSSVALLPDDQFELAPGACVCTPNGPQLLFTRGGHDLEDIWPEVGMPIGAPTRVGAGDLDGGFTSLELVFGDPGHDGPRILTRGPYSGYQDVSPQLPPSTPHPAPVFESVLVADMDGDGDLDLVHELRLLLNDGNWQWSVGASLHALVPATEQYMLATDYDGDGDRDLLVYGTNLGNPTLLLQNDGATFHDATIGHLPNPAWLPTDYLSAGDVDGDGDEDLLIGHNGRSDLLRNDGGVFARVADVGPLGVLLDADFDGRPDLFTGDDVWRNRHALLHERRTAAPGVAWTLEVHAVRHGPQAPLAVLAVGRPGYAITLPGLGVLEVDLTACALLPVTLANGYGEATFGIPLTPAVVGVAVAAQAVIVEASALTLTGSVQDYVH